MEKEKLEELYQWIDGKKDDIIRDLIEIASIKSVSDSEDIVKPFGQGCIDVLDAMLKKGRDAGFATQNYENYVGSITYEVGAPQEETIGLWAHLDVVPEGEGWLSEPYQPVIRDGLLFGRGVGDNKSAAIGSFYIQQALRELEIPLKHNVKLFLGTNEEKGMADVKYYVKNYPVPKFSLVPDAGFPGMCGEFGRIEYDLLSKNALSEDFINLYAGSVFNIIPNKATAVIKKDCGIDVSSIPKDGYEVVLKEDVIEITSFGVSKHAAMPEGSVNAIYKLTRLLAALPGIKAEDKEILEFLTAVNEDSYGTTLGFAMTDEISGQTVSSGTVLRYESGHVRLTNDCRHCVTDSSERILMKIEETAANNSFVLETKAQSNPYHLDKSSKEIQTIQRVYQEYTGEDGEVRIGKGGTYAGKIPMAVATGICIRGNLKVPDYIEPGHGGAHQPDEFLPIANYIEGIKLLAAILVELDATL